MAIQQPIADSLTRRTFIALFFLDEEAAFSFAFQAAVAFSFLVAVASVSLMAGAVFLVEVGSNVLLATAVAVFSQGTEEEEQEGAVATDSLQGLTLSTYYTLKHS